MQAQLDKQGSGVRIKTITLEPSAAYDVIAKTMSKSAVEAQRNAIAWTVGVIDEAHMNSSGGAADRIYKGIKNTIRDKYQKRMGVDPAPDYPVDTELVEERKEVQHIDVFAAGNGPVTKRIVFEDGTTKAETKA
jgi:hypothetical protein